VFSKLAYLTLCRSIQLLVLLARGDTAKDLEILVLRQQLTVLRRQVPRPRFEPADRALLAAVSRMLPRSGWSCFLVKPETLLRWHRRVVAGAWTYPGRQTGRPPLDQKVQQLIVRLARENPRWGYQRHVRQLAAFTRGDFCTFCAVRNDVETVGSDTSPVGTGDAEEVAVSRLAALLAGAGSEGVGPGPDAPGRQWLAPAPDR
jgi:putative transposase